MNVPTNVPAGLPAGLWTFLTEDESDAFAPASSLGETVAAREFYVESGPRGPRSRLVQEGGVLFIRATNYRLMVGDLEPMAQRREALRRLRLELVKFTFTFRELPPHRWYKEIRVRIQLQPPVPVLQLRPRLTSAESTRTRSFSSEFAPTLAKLLQLDLKHTSGGSTSHTEQQPVVTALDLGPDGFGWTYQAREGAPLFPRGEQTIAVLELPPGTAAIAGTFDAEAIIARKLLGTLATSDTVPCEPPAPFLVELMGGVS